ncbi:putative TATA-box binding protein, partial [Piedraia hortae CBS 480.64]
LTPTRNIVSTANLDCHLDLRHVALNAINTEYSPKRSPGLTMRFRVPRVTGVYFSTGRLIIFGAKSLRENKLAARKFGRVIQKLGYYPRLKEMRIRNIVATFRMGRKIDCVALAKSEHWEKCFYEPERFPALEYGYGEVDERGKPEVTVRVFESGRVTIMGVGSEEKLVEVFEKMKILLEGFRR